MQHLPLKYTLSIHIIQAVLCTKKEGEISSNINKVGQGCGDVVETGLRCGGVRIINKINVNRRGEKGDL